MLSTDNTEVDGWLLLPLCVYGFTTHDHFRENRNYSYRWTRDLKIPMVIARGAVQESASCKETFSAQHQLFDRAESTAGLLRGKILSMIWGLGLFYICGMLIKSTFYRDWLNRSDRQCQPSKPLFKIGRPNSDPPGVWEVWDIGGQVIKTYRRPCRKILMDNDFKAYKNIHNTYI